MRQVLVTGGAGFIGSHVVDLLVKQGCNVIILDNLSSGQQKNIEKHSPENVHFIKGDITDVEAVQLIFSKYKDIEGVIHLAAQSKVGPSLENPSYDAEVNIQGTINILEISKKYHVKSFVHASSAAVYGNNEALPLSEDSSTLPLSPYGVSKLAGEEYVKVYGRLYPINVCSLRFANVYGPRQTADTEAGVISIFIEQLLKKETPTIYGDGTQTRDFVYVEDVADAVVKSLIVTDSNVPESPVFNVSSNSEISVGQLLREITGILEGDFAPNYQEERQGDIKRSSLNNYKISSFKNWTPTTALKKGLKNTITYYCK